MAITDWPIDERPRERLMTQGAGALSDAELIDKPFWRSVLLAARELQPVGAHSIH